MRGARPASSRRASHAASRNRPRPVGRRSPPSTRPRRRGSFIRESVAELQKVDWPNRAQTIQGTVVVIIAVLIVGAYLWGVDQVIRPFVRDVLLGQ